MEKAEKRASAKILQSQRDCCLIVAQTKLLERKLHATAALAERALSPCTNQYNHHPIKHVINAGSKWEYQSAIIIRATLISGQNTDGRENERV